MEKNNAAMYNSNASGIDSKLPPLPKGSTNNIHQIYSKDSLSSDKMSLIAKKRRTSDGQEFGHAYAQPRRLSPLPSSVNRNHNTNTAQAKSNAIMSRFWKSTAKVFPDKLPLKPKEDEQYLDSIKGLEELLEKLGESPEDVLPLLNPLLELDIPETEQTIGLSPGARTTLLSGFFVRIFDYLSTDVAIAIIIDNAHHMDSASWHLTDQILRRCPNVYIVLACEPSTDWHFKSVKQLADKPYIEHVELHTWTTNEVEAFVKVRFASLADKISPKLIETIFEASQGQPRHVIKFIQYLVNSDVLCLMDDTLSIHKEYGDAYILATVDQLLLWKQSILSKEVKSVLRAAAVIGPTFSIEELNACIHGISHSVSDQKKHIIAQFKLERQLFIYDRLGIVERLTEGHPNFDNQSPYTTQFQFTSIPMHESIVKRASEAKVEEQRHELLSFYEHAICNDTETWFIPKICYQNSMLLSLGHIGLLKKIKYLCMLGNHLCISAEAYLEARQIFESMQNIVETNNLQSEVGANIMSEWHFHLSSSYSRCLLNEQDLLKSEKHIEDALNLLAFKNPTVSDAELNHALWREGAKWMTNNFDVFANKPKKRHRFNFFKKFSRDKYKQQMITDRLERLEPVLARMSRHLFETESKLWDQIVYDLLYANVLDELEKDNNTTRIRILGGIALKMWFAGHQNLALRVVNWLPGMFNLKSKDPQSYAVNARFLTASGMWYDANVWASRGMELCETLGEDNSLQVCGNQRLFMMVFSGRFSIANELVDKLACYSRISGDTNCIKSNHAGILMII